MMRFKTRTKETGQALVLIAMLIVILLAALGLAIDGGGMFLLWRDAQNAVDTSAMQAAFAYCTSNESFATAQDTGLRAAKTNGFDNLAELSPDVPNWVTIVQNPTGRVPAGVNGNGVFLVTIRAQKPAYFIQLVYGGPLEISVDAIGACNPGGNLIYDGYSMFAMATNEDCWGGDVAANSAHSQISNNGARQDYYGPLYSNGNASAGGSSSGMTFHEGATVSYAYQIDDSKWVNNTGTASVGKQQSAITDKSVFPALFTYDQFAPGGEVWEAIELTDPSMNNYVNGFKDFADDTVEGLWVVNGDIEFGKTQIGPAGATFVATGQIRTKGNTNGMGMFWHPYTGNSTTNKLLMFSTQTVAGCDTTPAKASIAFNGSNMIGFGILYAPNSSITLTGSDKAWCGAIIGQAVDMSGADTVIFGQSIPMTLPNTSPYYPYRGYNCDFIDNTPANYFIGE
jgi:hypothetical protein